MGHSKHKVCLIFNYNVRAKVAKFITSRDCDSRPLDRFNAKSMIQGVVSNSNFSLRWCQWLLQSTMHIHSRESLQGGFISEEIYAPM